MSPRPGRVAIVLHAHLPYVRSLDADEDVEERWLYEAMWESYLPLLAMLERHAEPAHGPALSLSLSPTLLSMLEDPHHREGFRRYAGVLGEMCDRAADKPGLEAGVADHRARLDAGLARFDAARGKLVGAFAELDKAERLELLTTSATHAFLPNLLTPAAMRAQLRLGGRYLHALTGITTRGLWLPECGFDPRVGKELAASGASYTVIDAHGLELARPAPPFGLLSPILSPEGVAYFGRHTELVARVWSHEHGYPGDSVYREFHADLAMRPEGVGVIPEGFVGPSGLRPFRITGQAAKQPYSPLAARKRARAHAADWVRHIDQALANAEAPDPVVVLAFDAELFGHWFWEGVQFLDEVLTLLGERAVTLSRVLEADPVLPLSTPATSSWGDGGFAEVWTHPAVSHLLRTSHRAERRVLHIDELVRDTPRTPVQRRARLSAIRQLCLLQASDFAFMLRAGESQAFVERRVRMHAAHVERLTSIAKDQHASVDDDHYVRQVDTRWPLFSELDEDSLADALDSFE